MGSKAERHFEESRAPFARGQLDDWILSDRTERAWQHVASAIAREPLSRRLEDALVEAVVLALACGDWQDVSAWLDILESRLRSGNFLECPEDLAPHWTAVARGLRIQLLWSLSEKSAAVQLDGATDWLPVEDRVWVQNLRFQLLSAEERDEEAWAALATPLECLREPIEIGTRLTVLVGWHARHPESRDLLQLGDTALEVLRREEGLAARVREAQVLGFLGSCFHQRGDLVKAQSFFEQLFELGPARAFTLVRDTHVEDMALLFASQGRFSRAERALAEVPLPQEPRTDTERLRHVRRFLCHASIYIDCEDPVRARPLIAQALRGLRETPHPRLMGYALLTLGKYCALVRPPQVDGALRAWNKAERIFRSIGTAGVPGLVATLTAQGELYLARKDVERARECLSESLEHSRTVEHLPTRARCLLLKSLLLQAGALESPQTVHEELLRELGVVASPHLLFRVLANLYMFSWQADALQEWTSHHYQQLTRLQTQIDADVFRRLYHRYVRNRVGRRTIRRLFGCEPEDLLDR